MMLGHIINSTVKWWGRSDSKSDDGEEVREAIVQMDTTGQIRLIVGDSKVGYRRWLQIR
jgi:hypothetical protein